MPLPTPAPGLVISYSYLWRDQRLSGETSGRKARPCAIVLTSRDDDGDTIVHVAPITHRPPDPDGDAIALPLQAKRRLGLDSEPSWIIVSELNRFVWPGFDLRPIAHDKPGVFSWGFLPVDVFEALKAAIVRRHRDRKLQVIVRR